MQPPTPRIWTTRSVHKVPSANVLPKFTHLHRSSNPSSVFTTRINGLSLSVLLNSISSCPRLQCGQCGVLFAGSKWVLGLSDKTTSRNDPEKDEMNAGSENGWPPLGRAHGERVKQSCADRHVRREIVGNVVSMISWRNCELSLQNASIDQPIHRNQIKGRLWNAPSTLSPQMRGANNNWGR